MMTPGFQNEIPATNWMLPAGAMDRPLPAAFDTIVKPAKTLLFTPAEVNANRRAWIDEWLNAISR
jgi:thiamine transport system substrate-binding protein